MDELRSRSGGLVVALVLGILLGLALLAVAATGAYRLGVAAGSALELTGDRWAAGWDDGRGELGADAVELAVVVDVDDLGRRLADTCTELVGADGAEPLEDRTHLDDTAAETADELYDLRPPHSGRHLAQVLPVRPEAYPGPIDERAAVHNLEHGAILVVYDPDLLGGDEVAALEAWTVERNLGGFLGALDGAGVGVLVAPAEPGSISSGSAVALRAWGVATDCDGFDQVIADGFLATHYGDRGAAPERSFGPYPDGAVEIVRVD
ncbi:DUF3105 domain-containing protein [Nitriliruptor alkaliphilus]|uniref:DUF3105 domain-containing protein n=1 Tax=Nitriliruptor alkaliphilus TaxID=427918 RepID=UPI000695F04E|nr:DUF3105 domain-containing protein [Nitriliruptor alkaliphilus]